MTRSLAEEQALLVEALWRPRQADALDLLAPWQPEAGPARQLWARGTAAYRAQGRLLAQRVLAEAYPVVARWVGADNFTGLARQLWLVAPPRRGDLAQWGDAFAGLLAGLPDVVAHEPFLPDLARVEWALHAAATAADAAPDLASLALLAERDPAHVRLVLGPSACTVSSDHPVASLVVAHTEGEPASANAARLLRDGSPESALVWRHGLRPRVRLALPGEAPFIRAVQEKRSLLDSLERAPAFDLAAWLSQAVQDGLLLAASDLSQPEEHEK